MMYLTSTATGYMFTFGDSYIAMGDHGTVFRSRKAAVAAANAQGIAVHPASGKCVAAKGLNLDMLDSETAMAFWSIFHRPTRSDAELLVGDRRPGFTNIAAKLATYACNVAVAQNFRLAGNIDAALGYEAQNEWIYEALPEDCRW